MGEFPLLFLRILRTQTNKMGAIKLRRRCCDQLSARAAAEDTRRDWRMVGCSAVCYLASPTFTKTDWIDSGCSNGQDYEVAVNYVKGYLDQGHLSDDWVTYYNLANC